jgi:hypothetical protein
LGHLFEPFIEIWRFEKKIGGISAIDVFLKHLILTQFQFQFSLFWLYSIASKKMLCPILQFTMELVKPLHSME